MIVPLLDKIDGERRLVSEQNLLVKSNAGPGIMGGKADGDHARNAIRSHLLQRVGDKRAPVAHANVNRKVQLARHCVGLLARDPGQGRAANQRVAMLHLAHHRFRHGPAARDVLQELGNVLHLLRTAVSDEQHRRLAHSLLAGLAAVKPNSCTNCARSFTLETGVCGKMPWPRLKMCPGRPSARRRMCSARRFSSGHDANSNTGSRLPCTARVRPTVRQPSSRGTRQSKPMTSAPVSAMEGSRVALSVPKLMIGT